VHYFRYHSTNCFIVENNRGELLAVDAGWPCSFFEYARLVKSIGFRMKQIRWVIVTHFHMDHAGSVSDFMEQGIQCIVFQNQETAIDPMERTIRKNYRDYKPINQESLIRWNTDDSKKSFAKIGIAGRALITRGHSDDSISFLTGNQEAIIGDLCPVETAMAADDTSAESYALLRANQVKFVFPSHAPFFDLRSN
jgi:ribonuclease/clavin/mitogillin